MSAPLELTPPPPDYEDDTDTHTAPHNNHAEQAVLAALLTGAPADPITANIDTGDLYQPRHRLIFEAILELVYAGHTPDPTAVADTLGRNLDRAGGHAYLHELALNPPIDPGYYADIIRDTADRRHLFDAATRLAQLAHNRLDQPLAELLTDAHTQLDTIPARASDTAAVDTWAPVDIGSLLTGEISDIKATIGPRRDGQCLLYAAAVHSISGEPGSGKTWFAQVIAARELTQGHPVLYIDFEDRPTTIIGRLRALGVTDDQIRAGLRYIRPDAAMTPTIRERLTHAAADVRYAVIDGITEAMTLHGLSLMDNEDVARWLHLLPRRLADLGCAVLQIDHVVKNSEARGRYAIGGQHKLAGIDGAAYKILVTKPFGKGAYGRAKLVMDKDRHGDIAPTGTTAADLHIDGRGDQITGWLDDPTEDHAPDGTWRPTGYMEKIARVIEANPGVSTNAICAAVRGKKDHIKHALAQLVTEGNVRVENGARGSANHYLIQPFAEAADDQF